MNHKIITPRDVTSSTHLANLFIKLLRRSWCCAQRKRWRCDNICKRKNYCRV